ncbi:MAG: hypothetical protein Q9164_003850 [Protoblastenia rupestris]
MSAQYNFHFHNGDGGKQPPQAANWNPWPTPTPNTAQLNPTPPPARAKNPWSRYPIPAQTPVNNSSSNPSPQPGEKGDLWGRFPIPPQAPINDAWGKSLPQPGEKGNPWTDPKQRPAATSDWKPQPSIGTWNDPWSNSATTTTKSHKPDSNGEAWEEQIGPNQFIRHSGTANEGTKVRAPNSAPNSRINTTTAPAALFSAGRRTRQRNDAAVVAESTAPYPAADRGKCPQRKDEPANEWPKTAAAGQGRRVSFAQGVALHMLS